MKLRQTDRSWVERTLAALTVREKLGQIMVARLTPDAVRPYGSVTEFIQQLGLGGVHCFGGDAEQTHATISEAQEASRIRLLVSGDLERGLGQRIAGGTEFAGQLALGASGDADLACRMGEAIAVEGRAVGYNWAFGPVVDLCRHPDAPSNIRCFGAEPEMVERLAPQVIRGMQDNGMAATAKHLPGDGLDDLDSHLTTPVNPLSREEWFALSGRAFRAAIDARVWSVMASPVACPGIDPECGDPLFPRPVMTSRAICTDLLRGQMGFEGLVVTDALTMGGLTMHMRRLEMHLACLNAGCDVLLFVHRLESVYEYLERCLEEGSLAIERLDEAVRRVLELKARIGLNAQAPMINHTECAQVLARSPYGKDAEQLAERSITLLRDSADVVPLGARPGLKIASILITNRPEFTHEAFDAALAEAGCEVTSIKNPPQETLYERIEAGQWDALVIGLYYPPQWGWATTRCHGPEARCLMDGFPFANPDVPAVFISWANPFHLYEFAFMDPYLMTYGGCPGTQRAAARALLGQIPITGRSPVALPPLFEVGDGIERKHKA